MTDNPEVIPGPKSGSRRSTENKSIAKGRGGSDLRENPFLANFRIADDPAYKGLANNS